MLRIDLREAVRRGAPYRLTCPIDEAAAVARTRALIELHALLDFCSDIFNMHNPYTEQEQAEHFFMYAQGHGKGGNDIPDEHVASIMTYLDPKGEHVEFSDAF